MRKLTTREICTIALFTALICVLGQFSIPLPGGVPMTLQTLIIPLAGVVLGAFGGTMATIIYLLLGAVGVPVFAGWSGGIGVLVGMTGGFLVSFPLLALTAGWGDSLGRKMTDGKTNVQYYVILVLFLLLGAILNYAVGTVWFVVVAKSTFAVAFGACVAPFIPTAILKIILTAILGPVIKHVLVRANVILPNTGLANA